MPKLRKLALAVALCLIVTLGPNGCDTFVTVRDTQASGKSDEAGEVKIENGRLSGLVYYLPKGRIRITGDFKPSSAPGGSDSKPGPGRNQGASKPSPSPMEKLSREDSGEPSDSEQKNFYISVSVDIEADPRARYYLKAERNYFYDDDLNLKINAKHLLSTGNATVEDQTAQIISSTAQIVAQFVEPGAKSAEFLPEQPKDIKELLFVIQDAVLKKKVGLQTTIAAAPLYDLPDAFCHLDRKDGEEYLKALQGDDFVSIRAILKLLSFYPVGQTITWSKAKDFWKELSNLLKDNARPSKNLVMPRPFSVVFDPADSETVKALKEKILECGFNLAVNKSKVYPNITIERQAWSKAHPEHVHGIAFRPVIPYELKITSVDNTGFYIHEQRTLLLPDTDGEHTLVLDYSRVPFVKKTTNIAFVDGIPQDLGWKVPSPVLGFLAIPKGILQALVPLPQTMAGPSGMQAMGNSTAGAATSPPPQSH
jgi:hypothetical protein